jgi:hypothetical protein
MARTFLFGLAALFLAIRTIGGAGYMPSVEQGRLTLILCPDGEWTAPHSMGMGGMKGHGHDHGQVPSHDPCPYAASASPFAGTDAAAKLQPPKAAAELRLDALFTPLLTSTRVERPFATGPPASA